MEFSIHNLQKAKIGVHGLQLAFIIVVWVMDIVLFRKVSVDSKVIWNFALCFVSLVPLVYLTMTPRFPRTRKFANPYALAAVDLLFAILWLSAFASVANWNQDYRCKDACGVGRGITALSFFIWIFWCLTTAMSVYGLIYFRREGFLPGASRAPTNAQHIDHNDPDKEAFSTGPHDEYAPVQDDDNHEFGHGAGAGPSRISLDDHSEVPSFNAPSYHTGAYQPPQVHDEPTGYSGYNGAAAANDGPAKFPTGRYDNL